MFQKILNESNHKPNKIGVDKGNKFYNRPMESWLEKNGIEMYSIYNEGEFVIAERFIRIKKKKKFIATWLKLEKNFYIDKLMILMI